MQGGQEGRPRGGRPSSQVAAWQPLDRALMAYVRGQEDAALVMCTDVGGSEEVPVALFYRDPGKGTAVERRGLEECRGRVLDVGACVGAFAVPLMEKGLEVTALEVLPAACTVLRERGVGDVRRGGLDALSEGELFDTVLVMMNGLGLAGTLSGLERFLSALQAHLSPGGQIVADSTDAARWEDTGDGRYPGEVHMQLIQGETAGDPFPFLFVDAEALAHVATAIGLQTEVLERDADGRYLVRLTAAQED